MSDCSSNAWHVPEQREPGVLYDHGQPNYDYLQARAIVIGGVRFERVRTCHLEETVHQREIASEFGGGYYEETTHDCDECGFENADCNIRFCGGCGAEVVSADE